MFKYDWLSNPSLFQDNVLALKSRYHTYHSIQDEQLKKQPKTYLNGTWGFDYALHEEATKEMSVYFSQPMRFFDTIKVPGHIQRQGFGKPKYVNVQYPWDGIEAIQPPDIPSINPVGVYILDFDYEQKHDATHLCFEGVESAFAVWLNGQYVGYKEDTFTGSMFDVTKWIQPTNRLVVKVYQYCSGSWFEDQDFWRMSGIFRDVYLIDVKAKQLHDLSIQATLINDYQDGLLHVSFDGDDDLDIGVSLWDESTCLFDTKAQNNQLTIQVPHVKAWSAEQPNLYALRVEVKLGEELIEIIHEQVGFRVVELSNGVMLFNGKRLIFNGVNRHEWSHQTGRAVTKEDMLADLTIMKQHNINAIRTSHYPNHPDFYRLCNEMGFYVIDEVNLETHGAWSKYNVPNEAMPDGAGFYIPGNDMQYQPMLLQRAKNMVERDKNHPCIVMWSCGNESLGGMVIASMADYFRSVDNSRLVHYEGEFNDRSVTISDVESRMYDKIEHVEAFLKQASKPFIYCEYAHAMGNSLGNFFKFQELTKQYIHYQGGFVWEFKDHAFQIEENGKKVLRYGGDFGDRPTDYNFVCDGLINGDRTLTPKIKELAYIYQPFQITINKYNISIHNHYLFTDLSDYLIEIIHLPSQDIETLSLELQPGMSTSFAIKSQGDEAIYVAIKDGEQVISYEQKTWHMPVIETVETKPVPITQGHFNCGINIGALDLLFSQIHGFNSFKINQFECFKNSVQVSLDRAWTDNDIGAGLKHSHAMLCIMSDHARQSVIHEQTHIRVRHHLLAGQKAYVDVIYEPLKDGLLINVDYPGFEQLPDFLNFGLMFELDASFDQVVYSGLGPYENYVDRHLGSVYGTYKFNVKDNLTPYIKPQECGNRTQVTKLSLTSTNKQIEFIAVDEAFEMQVLSYSKQQLTHVRHMDELKPEHTFVRISKMHSGVGGDDSWGARCHPEYQISSNQPYQFRFILKGN